MKKGAPTLRSKRENRPQGPAASAKQTPPEMRIRPENGLGGFEFLTPSEAITWAAFGQAVKAEDLISVLAPELARWSRRPRIWLPKLFSSYEPFGLGEYSPSLILDTLLAFENRENGIDEIQRRYLAFYMARRELLGLPDLPNIADHIEFLRRYLSQAADVEMKLIESKREFLKLISRGHIKLGGIIVHQGETENHHSRPMTEQIKKEIFQPGVSIDFDGYLTYASGEVLFRNLIADLDDVLRAYPFGPIEPIDRFFLQPPQPANTSTQPDAGRQRKGGRPRGESTLLAETELARLLALGKLPEKPKDILGHLEEFFEREKKTMPAESTLKEMIQSFLEGLRRSRNPSANSAGN